jgi:hypothetical protein
MYAHVVQTVCAACACQARLSLSLCLPYNRVYVYVVLRAHTVHHTVCFVRV